MNLQDTITAIATPIGSGGIGVIRISGPEAFTAAERVFSSPKKRISDFPSHTAHLGRLIHPQSGQHLDDVVLTIFRGPHSYTGEDVIEISCHGGINAVKSALNAVLAAGARLAEPGEFTQRAFLNGRIDLAQAEAVNDIIRAQTDEARRAALRQLDGKLSGRVNEIGSTILSVIAAIEAAIDFPEDVPEPEQDWVQEQIIDARNGVAGLISTFKSGRIYREGLRMVIAGRVNVGKSSLLNALLRSARAIVTPIPGTTRDVIEENLEIRGIPIVAIDTAGLRSTDDPVEKIGVELTRQSIESADIVLLAMDASTGITDEDIRLFSEVSGRPTIVVANKTDLIPNDKIPLMKSDIISALGKEVPVVFTSASAGVGIENLEDEIADLVAASGSVGSEGAMVTNARHQQALEAADASLGHVLESLANGEPIDILSGDLMAARNALGLITGETAGEDLLDLIFSEFCIGK